MPAAEAQAAVLRLSPRGACRQVDEHPAFERAAHRFEELIKGTVSRHARHDEVARFHGVAQVARENGSLRDQRLCLVSCAIPNRHRVPTLQQRASQGRSHVPKSHDRHTRRILLHSDHRIPPFLVVGNDFNP